MLRFNLSVGSLEELEYDVQQHNSSTELPPQQPEELSSTWVLVARVWALFIAFIGIPGNLVTASTIIHQAVINRRRQRLHSVSDSCIQQLKIIKEGNVSELSDASSSSSGGSISQRGERAPVRKTTLCSRPPLSLKLPSHAPSKKRAYRKSSPGKNSLSSCASRESSPAIQLTTKHTTTVMESGTKTPLHSNCNSHSRSPVTESDEVFYDSKAERRSPDDGISLAQKNATPHNCSGRNNNNDIIGDCVDSSPSANDESQQHLDRCPSTSSQTSRREDCFLARKSSSIRSQSISPYRTEGANYSSKTSRVKIGADTILILHIILCDLFYCSVNLPHTYYVYGFDSVDGSSPVLCKEAAFVRYVNAFAEWMTLGLLAIQRCVDLAKPPNARFFRTKSTLTFVFGIWVLSVILQLGNLINDNFGYNPVTKKCDCVVGHMTSLLYFYTLDSLLPCSLMMFGCFSIIFQIVRNKRRLQRFGMSGEMVAAREKEMWHSACLVLSLLLLFLLCVLPICVFNVLFIFEVTDNVGAGVAVYMIYWVQYGVNFVVYVVSNRRFRHAYEGLFHGFRDAYGGLFHGFRDAYGGLFGGRLRPRFRSNLCSAAGATIPPDAFA